MAASIIHKINGKWLLNHRSYKELNSAEKEHFNQFWKEIKNRMCNE